MFLGSKITGDGDCSHEIKRSLLLGQKTMTNLDSVLKSRDITLPTKVHLVKVIVFPVVMYGCESWTIKKAECWRIDSFELLCWTLHDPLDCSMPGFPVLYYLPAFAQTHIHWVGDAIQPSHPLLSPSPPALNLSQHQGIFQWVGGLFESGGQNIRASALASVLPLNIQGWFPLGLTGLISLLSKGYSRVFCNTTVRKHKLFGTQPSLWSNSHIRTWLPEKP